MSLNGFAYSHATNQKKNSLWRHASLRPHGDRLLTPGASFWLFSAQVLVLAMAISEGVAWGYLGFLFGRGKLDSLLLAAASGMIIFMIVWVIDVSLLTLDRKSDEHAAKLLYGEVTNEVQRKRKFYLAIGSRVVFMVTSLAITAPYLSQLIFHKEIAQEIEKASVEIIHNKRNELTELWKSRVEAIDEEVAQSEELLIRELAGSGVTNVRGDGVVARGIRDQVVKKRQERDATVVEQQAALREFESAVKDWEKGRARFPAKFGILLPEPSVTQNQKALDSLADNPEYSQTEWAIRAFLAFIFIGIIILKLFEPRSVQYYLSEVLQQEYDRFLVGAFDQLLPQVEQASNNPGAMTPQRLYNFLVDTWAPWYRLEANQAARIARIGSARYDLEILEKMAADLAAELQKAQESLDSALEAKLKAAQDHAELESELSLAKGDLVLIDKDLQELRLKARYVAQEDIESALQKAAEARKAVAELENIRAQSKETMGIMSDRYSESQKRVKKLATRLEEIEMQVWKNRERLMNNNGFGAL